MTVKLGFVALILLLAPTLGASVIQDPIQFQAACWAGATVDRIEYHPPWFGPVNDWPYGEYEEEVELHDYHMIDHRMVWIDSVGMRHWGVERPEPLGPVAVPVEEPPEEQDGLTWEEVDSMIIAGDLSQVEELVAEGEWHKGHGHAHRLFWDCCPDSLWPHPAGCVRMVRHWSEIWGNRWQFRVNPSSRNDENCDGIADVFQVVGTIRFGVKDEGYYSARYYFDQYDRD